MFQVPWQRFMSAAWFIASDQSELEFVSRRSLSHVMVKCDSSWENHSSRFYVSSTRVRKVWNFKRRSEMSFCVAASARKALRVRWRFSTAHHKANCSVQSSTSVVKRSLATYNYCQFKQSTVPNYRASLTNSVLFKSVCSSQWARHTR